MSHFSLPGAATEWSITTHDEPTGSVVAIASSDDGCQLMARAPTAERAVRMAWGAIALKELIPKRSTKH